MMRVDSPDDSISHYYIPHHGIKVKIKYFPFHFNVCIASSDLTKTLGIYWSPADNTLNYRTYSGQNSDRITKRQLLPEISKVFDPLGLLSPGTVLGKIILQHV
ncbi:hypothetical protein ILUMI_20579 [Ignelater luminosus]|uniref:Uncharacterized protein n=1 Tax=Ignelater luminosus TaxID=2038154 RepID=A0A8K0CKL0_IGNLU|nr:hypothetical protein ILUMI_20579 [Ignelater luminosus]